MSGLVARARFELGTRRRAIPVARALRRAAQEAASSAEIVDVAFATSGNELSISPTQIRSEITAFVELVRAERPERVLEIGTSKGGTLYLLAWASEPAARLLSLDRFPDRVRLPMYRSFADPRKRVEVHTGNSQARETRTRVERFFGNRPLDVLFIDGDHSYEGVCRDYELYAPLVRPSGLIAFHDIVDGPEAAVGGVPRFWREVRSLLADPVELVESWQQGGYGIGVGGQSPAHT